MSGAAQKGLQAMPSCIRKLCKFGEEALKPQFVNERWRPPAVKARQAARIRKVALIEGTYGSFDFETGRGWDPAWDKPGKIGRLQRPKETKRERTRESRALKIENLMENMDTKVEQYREELEKRKPPEGIESYLKKLSAKKRK